MCLFLVFLATVLLAAYTVYRAMTQKASSLENNLDVVWSTVQETQQHVVHFMCCDTPLWFRAFQVGLKMITGPFFHNDMKKCIISERISEDDLGEHSPYKYVTKNLWPQNTISRAFPEGLPTSCDGKHTGMWPLKITHAGAFKVYSCDFTCGMPTLGTGTAPLTMTNTEKYIIFFKKDNKFARLLGDRVKSVVAEFVHHESFQGYIIYRILEESGKPLEKYCEWVLEMYFSEGGLQPTTIHMGHIAAELDNDGYEVTYAGYKDVLYLPNQAGHSKNK